MATVNVAVVQLAPQLGKVQHNLCACLSGIRGAAATGGELIVLPECATSGYMLDSKEDARAAAVEIDGPEVGALAGCASDLGVHCLVGVLERSGSKLYNSAVLIGPDGVIGAYRKTHLPRGGVDRFVEPGDELGLFDTSLGRLGVQICYDLRFPELSRALTAGGARLLLHPTNWPIGARPVAEIVTRARAFDNRVPLVSANRYGAESWGEFCGRSQIVSSDGEVLALAPPEGDSIISARVQLATLDPGAIVTRPGEYELHLMHDRRPDLYLDSRSRDEE
ncbi:MAG: carbon-nitrogen hydrolase family protein [Roseiarcus sp.]